MITSGGSCLCFAFFNVHYISQSTQVLFSETFLLNCAKLAFFHPLVDSENSNVCEKSFVSRDPFDFLLHRATTTGNTSGNSGSGSIDNPDGGVDGIFAGRALATTVAAEAIYSTPVKKHLRNASLVIFMHLFQRAWGWGGVGVGARGPGPSQYGI